MLLAVSAVLVGFLPEKHIKKQGGKRAFLSISGPASQNLQKSLPKNHYRMARAQGCAQPCCHFWFEFLRIFGLGFHRFLNPFFCHFWFEFLCIFGLYFSQKMISFLHGKCFQKFAEISCKKFGKIC